MPDISKLDPMAACFAEAILQEFPDWSHELELIDTCEARLKVKQPGSDRLLDVWAGSAKVSMSYGKWSFVIGTFLCDTTEATIGQTMDIIRGIVSEGLRADITYDNGVQVQSSLGQAFLPIDAKSGQLVRAYSWRGTHDATVQG